MRTSFAVVAGLIAVAVATKPTYVSTATVDVTVTSCAPAKTDCPYKPSGTYWGDADVPAETEDPSKTWGDADVPSKETDGPKTWVDAEVPSGSDPKTWGDAPVAGGDPSKTWGDADVPSKQTDGPATWVDAEVPASAVTPATWADASTLVTKPTGSTSDDKVADYKKDDSEVAEYTGAASSTVASIALAGFAAVAAMIVV